jgi:hypothetical protein
MPMETINPLARDFILFCIQRRGKEWPALYDEMCWVAGHRLFQELGYTELRRLGISLSLTNIEDTIRMVDIVTAEKEKLHSGKEPNYTS